MATTKKPTDVTGQTHIDLQRQQLDDQAKQAAETVLARAEAQSQLETTVIDATKAPQPTVVVDEVVTVASTKQETTIIRVVEDIDSMTFGAGNTFSFRAGQKYEVNKLLADHLREKGYLSNVL
jgi:hypothetical protein